MSYRRTMNVLVLVLLSTLAFGEKKEKSKAGMKDVDSGSFSVFVQGKRVARETFRILQGPDASISTSEFKTVENGDGKSSQRSELELTVNGEVVRYVWKELSPGRAEATIEPSGEILVEHLVPNQPAKPSERPYLLPPSTLILDDYFFIHREILLWRYLAQACSGTLNCRPAKVQFGVIVPQQVMSSLISVEYAGKDRVTIRGSQMDLDRFQLTGELGDWTLWLDGHLKLQKISVPAENTEVVRD